MGNHNQAPINFDASSYVRPGITQQEVLGLRNVFEQLEPKNGVIETSTLRRLYRDSYDAPALNVQIGNRENLNFDQFFDIMSKNLIETKQKFKGDVQFEEREEEATCLFCPQTKPTGQRL